MSVQLSSMAIGLVLGWITPARAEAVPIMWFARLAGLALAIWIATFATPLAAAFAVAGAVASFSARALLEGSLHRWRAGA